MFLIRGIRELKAEIIGFKITHGKMITEGIKEITSQ